MVEFKRIHVSKIRDKIKQISTHVTWHDHAVLYICDRKYLSRKYMGTIGTLKPREMYLIWAQLIWAQFKQQK